MNSSTRYGSSSGRLRNDFGAPNENSRRSMRWKASTMLQSNPQRHTCVSCAGPRVMRSRSTTSPRPRSASRASWTTRRSWSSASCLRRFPATLGAAPSSCPRCQTRRLRESTAYRVRSRSAEAENELGIVRHLVGRPRWLERQVARHLTDAGDLPHDALDVLLDHLAGGAAHRRQRVLHLDVLALDLRVVEEAQLDDVHPELGILDLAERLDDFFLGRHAPRVVDRTHAATPFPRMSVDGAAPSERARNRDEAGIPPARRALQAIRTPQGPVDKSSRTRVGAWHRLGLAPARAIAS